MRCKSPCYSGRLTKFSPQLGPRTEERETFTRLLGHPLKGTWRSAEMFDVPKLRLDVQSLDLRDERLIRIATIIAEETEVQREQKRAEFPDSGPEPGQNKLMELLGGYYSYANTLRWDLLLTFGDCAGRCAKRASMGWLEILEFAREHCRPSDPWLLFWYETALKALRDGVDSELQASVTAQALADAQSKHQRIREGARVGGQKSAQRRRQIQSTPLGPVLLAERTKLIDGGMDARNVAAFQAKKYSVTPAAIRAAYKRN